MTTTTNLSLMNTRVLIVTLDKDPKFPVDIIRSLSIGGSSDNNHADMAGEGSERKTKIATIALKKSLHSNTVDVAEIRLWFTRAVLLSHAVAMSSPAVSSDNDMVLCGIALIPSNSPLLSAASRSRLPHHAGHTIGDPTKIYKSVGGSSELVGLQITWNNTDNTINDVQGSWIPPMDRMNRQENSVGSSALPSHTRRRRGHTDKHNLHRPDHHPPDHHRNATSRSALSSSVSSSVSSSMASSSSSSSSSLSSESTTSIGSTATTSSSGSETSIYENRLVNGMVYASLAFVSIIIILEISRYLGQGSKQPRR